MKTQRTLAPSPPGFAGDPVGVEGGAESLAET